MVFLSASPELSPDSLKLFHTTEPLLHDAPILVFRGPASSAAATSISSSRIQIHVFTPAGFQSYSRLAISPNSPLYGAVKRLSREDQGDEVCRELAYGVYKYFSELPPEVRDQWTRHFLSAKRSGPAASELFTEQHAANVASRLQEVEHLGPVIEDVKSALASKSLSYQDVDVVLPQGSISADRDADREWTNDGGASRYGKYAPLMSLLGGPTFLPTSRMKRAPSKPTSRNHSLKYTLAQRESLRREMSELVTTERSYVDKLQRLLSGVVADVRTTVKRSPQTTSDSDAGNVKRLFPSSLDAIVKANAAFAQAIDQIFDDSKATTQQDLSSGEHDSASVADKISQDAIGILSFAQCLQDYLPQFRNPYAAYIQAHEQIGQTLRLLTQAQDSDVSDRLREVGEKKLTSLLIEPVQRLPRYSLYIENMAKQLPAQHPALKHLLKAKDIIADICATDHHSGPQSSAVSRLRTIVQDWPSIVTPKFRLISAFDLVEIGPPYNLGDRSADTSSFVGLLFADALVLLHRPFACDMNARSLLVEMDSTSVRGASNSPDNMQASLCFSDSYSLHDLRLTEMQEDRVIQLATRNPAGQRDSGQRADAASMRAFYVGGQYESRASKLTREILRARIEGRFSESDREDPKWQALELPGDQSKIGLLAAVFEEPASRHKLDQRLAAVTKLVLDAQKHGSRYSPSREGADNVISVTVAGNGFFRLEIDSVFSEKTKDFVTGNEFNSVLSKRLTTLAQMRGSLRNPLLVVHLLRHYDAILKSIKLPGERLSRSPSRTKSIRQHSPVKAIASLFGGSSKSSHEQAPPPPVANVFTTSQRPNLGPKSLSETRLDKKPEAVVKSNSTATIVAEDSIIPGTDPTATLEPALETFVLALRARKGNIIGRVIANRTAASEVDVNHLYNSLLERPDDHEPAAQAPVDVLFAAFEKFLKVAWKNQFGPILDAATMDALQTKSCTLTPFDFEEYLSKTIDDMIPQNRRALRGVVGLLIDLLDGTGNDGDRGALMATITEIMVTEGSPHDYMSLFDRFVEDHDVILSETFHSSTPHYGSTAMRSANTGSFSSKASSWGKRLGFGSLGRKNSRTEAKAQSQDTPKSPRAFLERTRSVDWGKASTPISRPGSKDRPPTAGDSRPATGKSGDRVEPLDVFKASGVFSKGSLPRKKRRSSLSDIEGLPSVNTSPFWNSPSPRKPDASPLAHRPGASPLRQGTPSMLSRPRPRMDTTDSPPSSTQQPSPSPYLGKAAQSGYATVTPTASPTRMNAVRHRSPTKENQPPVIPSVELSPPTSGNLARAQSSPTRRERNLSNLPPSRAPLSERIGSGNTPPPPLKISTSRNTSDKDTSPTKLRTPSPSANKALQTRPPSPSAAKTLASRPRTQTAHITSPPPDTDLPSRLADNFTAIANAEAGLMAELAKIGQEMAAVPSTPSRMGSRREDSLRSDIGSVRGVTGTTPRKENLEGRLKALEMKVPHLFRGLAERTRVLEEECAVRDARIRELEGMLGRR